MADFDLAVSKTLSFEGGFYDRSATTGELVNLGITLDSLRSTGILSTPRNTPPTTEDRDFVFNMTEAFAKQFYFEHYWYPLMLDKIVDQDVASKVFDLNVNTGRGGRFLQEGINLVASLGHVAEDGIVGPITIRSANLCDPKSLLAAIRAVAEKYYRQIATNPMQAQFLTGWLTRLAA